MLLERSQSVFYALCALIVIGGSALAFSTLDATPPNADGEANVSAAYHIYKSRTFSVDRAGSNPQPSIEREPLYPAMLSLAFVFQLDKADNLGCILSGECENIIRNLKIVNVVLFVLTLALTAVVTYRVTEDRRLTVLALIFLAGGSFFYGSVNRFYSELPGALLVALTSVSFLTTFQRKSFFWAVMSGVSLCALLYVKAVFFYLPAALLVCLPLFIFVFRNERVFMTKAVLVIAAVSILGSLPWLIRNHDLTGEYKISGRGDIVLAIRANYDTMPWAHVPAAILYFTPDVGKGLTKRFYGNEVHESFNQENPASYYSRAKTDFPDPVQQRAEEENIDPGRAAIEIMRENAGKHLVLSAVFLYRSYIPLLSWDADIPKAMKYFAFFLAVLMLPALLGWGLWSLYRRDAALFMFTVPSLFSVCLHALATHYNIRFNMPLIPVMLSLVCLAVAAWLDYRNERKPGTRARRPAPG